MPSYRSTTLYGGAVISDLPQKFADVSLIRQVPSNQEVWIDEDGYTTIIFDMAERVGGPGSSPEIDGKALTTHLEDIVGDDIDTVKVWSSSTTQFSKMKDDMTHDLPAYTLIATQTPQVDRGKETRSSPDFTAIVLTLLRLEKEKTDVLITINVPHIKGEYDEDDVDLELGKHGVLIGEAIEHSAAIWRTFKIKDWNLFGTV